MKRKCLNKISFQDLIQITEELYNYNLIMMEVNKKEPKITKISLPMELQELIDELEKLEEKKVEAVGF